VARGAAAAPGATGALVQQALLGEPGHPAAARHAAALLAAAGAGAARSPMAALHGPPAGARPGSTPYRPASRVQEHPESCCCACLDAARARQLRRRHTARCPDSAPSHGAAAWTHVARKERRLPGALNAVADAAGALELNRKAHAAGVVAGMAAAAGGADGRAPGGAAAHAARTLQAALDARGPPAVLHAQ